MDTANGSGAAEVLTAATVEEVRAGQCPADRSALNHIDDQIPLLGFH